MMSQQAAQKDVANCKLRRLLAYDKSLYRAFAEVGGAALSYKAANRKITPRRRGPAKISDIDETGVTARFQPQTFKVARFCE